MSPSHIAVALARRAGQAPAVDHHTTNWQATSPRFVWSWRFAVALTVAGAAAGAAANPPTLGPLQQVHSGEAWCQRAPHAIPLADGDTLVWWEHGYGDNGNPHTERRILSSTGEPRDVSTPLAGRQLVALLPADGNRLATAVWRTATTLETAELTAAGEPTGGGVEIDLPQGLLGLDAAVAADGAIALSWTEAAGLRLRVYAANGTPRGPVVSLSNFVPNSITHFYARTPAKLSWDESDRFYAAWVTPESTGRRVALRRFDHNGQPVGTTISPSVGLPPGFDDAEPFVLVHSLPGSDDPIDGYVALAWTRYSAAQPPAAVPEILVRRYSHDGVAMGPAALQTDDVGHAFAPRLASGMRGALAVSWSELPPGFTSSKALVRLLSGPGSPSTAIDLHPENLSTWGLENATPRLSYTANGALAAVWELYYFPNILPTGCEQLGIYARTLDLQPRWAAPTLDGGNVQLGSSDLIATHTPRIAVAADGRWLAAWRDGSCGKLRARLFGADDVALGEPMELEAALPATCVSSAPATRVTTTALADGSFMVAWASEAGGPVAGRRVFANGTLGAATLLVSSTTTAPILVSDGNGLVLSWLDVATAQLRLRRFTADGLPIGDSKVIASNVASGFYDFTNRSDGGYAVAWNTDDYTIVGQLLSAGLFPAGELIEVVHDPNNKRQVHPRLARDQDGGFAVAWTASVDPYEFGSSARLRRYAADGTPRGDAFSVEELQHYWAEDDGRKMFVAGIAAGADGGHLLLIQRTDVEPHSIHLLLVRDGEVLGPSLPLETADTSQTLGLGSGAVVTAGCDWLTGWASVTGGLGSKPHAVAQRIHGGCNDDPDRLGLLADRFELTASWSLPDGRLGEGRAVNLGDRSGAFWFFSPDNPELYVKLLDGRPINGAFWVFHAALTSAAVELEVFDTVSGERKVYRKAAGEPTTEADVFAFVDGGSAPVQAGLNLDGSSAEAPSGVTTHTLAESATDKTTNVSASNGASPCDSAIAPCVGGGRFRVQVGFFDPRDPQTPRQALGRPAGADGLAFWFFDNDVIELMVKVLDGRAVNGHFWVFHAGLSDVSYRILVEDTVTGRLWFYDNNAGTLAARADTTAF